MSLVGGMEFHPSACVKASAHRPFNAQIRQHSSTLSGQSLAQEALISTSLVDFQCYSEVEVCAFCM